MKGLILKDIYNLSYNVKQLAIMLVFFGICFSPSFGAEGVMSMSTIMCMIMVITTFSFDERSEWNKYALIMPVTRKELVFSKYIVAILASSVGIVFGFIWGAGYGLVMHKFDGLLLLTVAGVGLLVAMAFGAVLIPLIVKFGTEKSRYILMAVVAIPTLIGYFIMNRFPQLNFDSWNWPVIGVAGAAVILAAYYISYCISVAIMNKKEF